MNGEKLWQTGAKFWKKRGGSHFERLYLMHIWKCHITMQTPSFVYPAKPSANSILLNRWNFVSMNLKGNSWCYKGRCYTNCINRKCFSLFSLNTEHNFSNIHQFKEAPNYYCLSGCLLGSQTSLVQEYIIYIYNICFYMLLSWFKIFPLPFPHFLQFCFCRTHSFISYFNFLRNRWLINTNNVIHDNDWPVHKSLYITHRAAFCKNYFPSSNLK